MYLRRLALVTVLVVAAASSTTASAAGESRRSCFYTPSGTQKWCAPRSDGPDGYWYTDCGDVWRGRGKQQWWLLAEYGNSLTWYARPRGRGWYNISAEGGRVLLGRVERQGGRWNIYLGSKLIGYSTWPTPVVVGLMALTGMGDCVGG